MSRTLPDDAETTVLPAITVSAPAENGDLEMAKSGLVRIGFVTDPSQP
ncbi:MAG: hypothetical protein ABL892_04880 [Thiobacillaceae bacterium]